MTAPGTPDTTGDVFARTATTAVRKPSAARLATLAGAVVLGLALLIWGLVRRGDVEQSNITHEPSAAIAQAPVASSLTTVTASAPSTPSSEAVGGSAGVLAATSSQGGAPPDVERGNSRPSTAGTQHKGAAPAKGATPSGNNRVRPPENKPIDVGY
ncbi:MAG: hypothetical protein QM784_18130 [Polyangiaceae bacterium]